jgi:hypothetical protein
MCHMVEHQYLLFVIGCHNKLIFLLRQVSRIIVGVFLFFGSETDNHLDLLLAVEPTIISSHALLFSIILHKNFLKNLLTFVYVYSSLSLRKQRENKALA